MIHADVKTVWDLMAYIVEHRESIAIRHGGRSFWLSEVGEDLAAAWVIEFVEKFAHSGFIPTRVLPEPRVHHLHHGVAACAAVTPAVRGMPKDWPDGHRWSVDWGEVTCLACLLHAPGPLE